LPFFITSIRL